MSTYKITLRHDYGTVTLTIAATSISAAIHTACEAEKAPESAITKVVLCKAK